MFSKMLPYGSVSIKYLEDFSICSRTGRRHRAHHRTPSELRCLGLRLWAERRVLHSFFLCCLSIQGPTASSCCWSYGSCRVSSSSPRKGWRTHGPSSDTSLCPGRDGGRESGTLVATWIKSTFLVDSSSFSTLLFHCIRCSRPWSSSWSPAFQIQLLCPSTQISTVPPLCMT